MMKLTIRKDYNGHKNVLFMTDDAPRDGYIVAEAGREKGSTLTTASGLQYKIHADWSVSAIETDAFMRFVVVAARTAPARRTLAQQAALIAARALA